ncbi:hypothetical protein [Streptomyces sp. NPDC051776]|uniref:hypothetical protein n=1 Tax=Streptomyces sp. NPDC051776 TaxID=3155414 RepID=UPI0034359144
MPRSFGRILLADSMAPYVRRAVVNRARSVLRRRRVANVFRPERPLGRGMLAGAVSSRDTLTEGLRWGRAGASRRPVTGHRRPAFGSRAHMYCCSGSTVMP